MPAARRTVDENLFQFCTVRQLEILEAINQHGSMRAAARALGVNFTGVHQALTRVEQKAAVQGYSPKHDLTHPVAPGQRLKGASLYYGKDGTLTGQWIKSTADDEAQWAIYRAAVEAMAEELPRLSPIPAPIGTLEALCNVYTLTDSHVGMLAWGEETGGEDWDLKIAESALVGCFERMVTSSPAATVGFVNQLGDYLHYDSAVNAVTPTAGHTLDADGRMPKMVRTAIRILRRVVDFALLKHEKVVLLLAEGNHDIAGSVWLRAMFSALYENEPRVQVIDSEMPYYIYQHGRTMLAFHHGHLKKNDQLPILFASQFPRVWGETTKRYCHTGHRHHLEEKEHSGMTVLQHPTLAARDAYASRHGWVAHRKVMALTYHSEFGEVARNTVTPEMLAPDRI